ncbi:hypothetical protein [Polynucleobacter antarcticus]|uniref:hypothetical protein n=1 Tax=Polynucleobacter antarcticus TaxID=1743162 RepID=UPI0039EF9D97
MYAVLAPLQGWDYLDYQAWRDDWLAAPQLTIDCLNALKNCWASGGNGCLSQKDWGGVMKDLKKDLIKSAAIKIRSKQKISDPNKLIVKRIYGQDDLKTKTDYFLSPSTIGAATARVMNFGGSIPNSEISAEYAKEMLESSFKQIKDGDLSMLEQMLVGQVIALNIAFSSLANRATRQTDRTSLQMLMNLSLKAQNQSRATIDSLIQLKQPCPTQFIKQANISGGHQQVNNLHEINAIPQNELLENLNERMDGGTQGTSKRADQAVEAMGVINGGKDT